MISHNEMQNPVMAYQLNVEYGNTFLFRHELGWLLARLKPWGSERHPPQITAKDKALEDALLVSPSDHFFSAPELCGVSVAQFGSIL